MSAPAGGFDFKIAADRTDDTYFIRVSGDIDLLNTPALAAHLEATDGRVTVDLAECTYFGSSAAAALVGAAPNGTKVTLRRIPTNVQRVLDIAGIAQLFSYER